MIYITCKSNRQFKCHYIILFAYKEQIGFGPLGERENHDQDWEELSGKDKIWLQFDQIESIGDWTTVINPEGQTVEKPVEGDFAQSREEQGYE